MNNELQEKLESYINGNLSVMREYLKQKPYMQLEVYELLSDKEKPIFLERVRAWHNSEFEYSNLSNKAV